MNVAVTSLLLLIKSLSIKQRAFAIDIVVDPSAIFPPQNLNGKSNKQASESHTLQTIATRPNISQLLSHKIRRMTFLHFIKLANLRILRL